MTLHAFASDALINWKSRTHVGLILRGKRTQASGKPLLLFLHGNGFACGVYAPILSPLLDRVDLAWLDLPGHGDSDAGARWPGWNQSAELAYEAFTSVLPEYGDVPVFIAGHSLGGVLSSLLVANHPGLVQAALLLDPVLFTPGMVRLMAILTPLGVWQRNSMARQARKRRSHWPDLGAARIAFKGKGMFRHWTDASLEAYLHYAMKTVAEGVVLKCSPGREAEVFGSYPRSLWPSIKRITRPLHIIYGAQSYPFVRESAGRIHRVNVLASSEAVSGSHFFLQEYPEQAVARIRAWLDRVIGDTRL